MQINSNNSYQPNFGALHSANAGRIKLYQIADNADKKFLKTLQERIDTKELMPNLGKDEYKRWNEMIEYGVNHAKVERRFLESIPLHI